MFCKEATPKTRHYWPVGIRSCSWAVLPNLNVPSALTHTSRSSQKAQSSPRDTGTGYTPAWFRLRRAGQGRAGAAPQWNQTTHRRWATAPVSCALRYCYAESTQLRKFPTAYIHYKNTLIFHRKVQGDIQAPLMILIIILISLTFLPSRLFHVITAAKVLTLAIPTEHRDFIELFEMDYWNLKPIMTPEMPVITTALM